MPCSHSTGTQKPCMADKHDQERSTWRMIIISKPCILANHRVRRQHSSHLRKGRDCGFHEASKQDIKKLRWNRQGSSPSRGAHCTHETTEQLQWKQQQVPTLALDGEGLRPIVIQTLCRHPAFIDLRYSSKVQCSAFVSLIDLAHSTTQRNSNRGFGLFHLWISLR